MKPQLKNSDSVLASLTELLRLSSATGMALLSLSYDNAEHFCKRYLWQFARAMRHLLRAELSWSWANFCTLMQAVDYPAETARQLSYMEVYFPDLISPELRSILTQHLQNSPDLIHLLARFPFPEKLTPELLTMMLQAKNPDHIRSALTNIYRYQPQCPTADIIEVLTNCDSNPLLLSQLSTQVRKNDAPVESLTVLVSLIEHCPRPTRALDNQQTVLPDARSSCKT